MNTIFIPVTANNYNFLLKYHPKEFRFTQSDDLGLILGAIYRMHSQSYKRYYETLDREKYPKDLKLSVRENIFKKMASISLRGVRAVNARIDKQLKKELYLYIKNARNENPKIKLRAAMTDFMNIYGLSMNARELASLDRNERRKREANGELLYKRKSKNVVNTTQLDGGELRTDQTAQDSTSQRPERTGLPNPAFTEHYL